MIFLKYIVHVHYVNAYAYTTSIYYVFVYASNALAIFVSAVIYVGTEKSTTLAAAAPQLTTKNAIAASKPPAPRTAHKFTVFTQQQYSILRQWCGQNEQV